VRLVRRLGITTQIGGHERRAHERMTMCSMPLASKR
jgi:hypothetical protein